MPRETVPTGFDYDFWLGQTPDVPYVKERTHFSFRYWWEYSGGTMTDWGAHHNDIVLWALNQDGSGPVSIEGKQLVEMIPGGYTAASEYEVTYTYANGVVHTCKSTTASEWWGGVKDPKGQQHGIKFIGYRRLDLGHTRYDSGQRSSDHQGGIARECTIACTSARTTWATSSTV